METKNGPLTPSPGSTFADRMRGQLHDEYEAFAACYEMPAYKALRLNRAVIGPEDYDMYGRLFTGQAHPEAVAHWQGAYYYTEDGPGRSPLHEAGAYYIQEPSAMLPVTMLDVSDNGLKVLDLCAAPGGKTTQAADLMNGCGLLVANEIISSRAGILSENIERMGVTNAIVTCSDPQRLADRFEGYFDRILVDAPCSGEGMFRKNPAAVNEWSPENVALCADRQDMILDCAVRMLSPAGRIVYSTCTFSPEEDEGAVERFLKRFREFTVCAGPHKLYPHTFKGEGHFAVAFERAGTDHRSHDSASVKAAYKPVPKLHYALLSSFLADTINENCRIRKVIEDHPERLTSFGDSLYLTPAIMPDISGLKVLRCGLKLGTVKKDRFEPDHALSHALKNIDVKNFVDLAPDSPEAGQYLSGMTINCDKDMKGWCLVTTSTFPLGWGKAVGGTLKNHYPKGLRKPL